MDFTNENGNIINNNDSGIYDFDLKTLGGKYENSFPLSFKRNPLNKTVFYSQLSNNSLISFSMREGSIQVQNKIEDAHGKRINEIFEDENVLYSCSNDSSVKLWDLNTNKLIKSFKKNPEEIYTISKSKHILAGGSSGKIIFWDLKVMKERSTFEESHGDDVTKIEFHPDYPTLLLAGSLDSILCLFDLAKENEEESIESMIRVTQPIDYCGFGGNKNLAYMISTVGTISLVDLPSASILFTVNAIDNTENNQYYLIECEKTEGNEGINYYRGRNDGFIEEFSLEKEPKLMNKFQIFNRKYIRCCKNIEENKKIIGSEDGIISIIEQQTSKFQNSLELEEKELFLEEEKNEDNIMGSNNKKKYKNEKNFKQNYFNPYKN